ncbi:DUF6599 family protein [Marinilabilia salmonicolor]|uniref:DUF6599 family protein n=1 Tax=Marinilabilia salmonicolor TaxID=989 RepID=UPI00029A6A5E|nr:DUF6599 family protein [Marinilabilia salmonicolor]
MKLLLFSFALMLSASVNAFSFTPPRIDGWQQDGEVKVFDQSNLFNHINGASEFYFSYNFQKVWVVHYEKGDAELTLEVYDHGDSNHAFGIYSMERPPEADVRKIGAQGYYEDAILNFVVDRYYVKMNSYREPGAGSGVLLNTAKKLVPDLSESTGLPPVIELFPQENRVLNTRQFIPNTFMGLEFMGSAFRAGYENDEGEVTMFIMERENNDRIKEILRNYFKFAQMDIPGLVEGEYVIEDPFNGTVYLYWEGNRLLGFSGDNVPSLRNFLVDSILK